MCFSWRAIYLGSLFLLPVSTVFAAIETATKQTANVVSSNHILNWSLGLLLVLAMFFACVWLLKKMGGLPVAAKENMRVLKALSLGMREKLVLVQVGDKQLLLGVTPGRIDKLLVLEGEDKLFQHSQDETAENDFAYKLKKLMAGANNE